MKVYFMSYEDEDHQALFCRKKYWDKNKVIEDGFSKGYDRLESAFEAIGVEVSGGGEAMYEGMSIKDIKKGLKKEGIKLLVNDKTFLEENESRAIR